MLTKRIIPCLDIRDGRTVKGVYFEDIRDAGDPVDLAKLYAAQKADELVFLDITATIEGRKTFRELVERIAEELNIPFTVGGGISTVDDVRLLLKAGADKVSINSAAVKKPDLVNELAAEFGSQCIVVAIDTKLVAGVSKVFINGGRIETDLKTLEWAHEVCRRGAGEILLTSMDHDGAKAGFALDITARLAESLPIPVIASGGAGTIEHFVEVFREGKADAALAASIFHFGEIPISELKQALVAQDFCVRI
jgi:imidazole glycerol-phosphate synthase subunit HisF